MARVNFKINPFIVRYYYEIYDQQITKVLYLFKCITSRNFRDYTHTKTQNMFRKFIIRPLSSLDNKILDNHNNEISSKFKEWFAGLTDGDGYIYVNKQGYIGYELTLPSTEEKVLRIIQNKFGGSVHARAGMRAIRYRTQKKDSIIKIIHCLNGLIINNIRLRQLHKAATALNIRIKDPVLPTINSAYLSGLLDSDGTINIYKREYSETFRYQLTISIANKSRSNLEWLLNIVGGQIYFDKTDNGCYF